MSGCRRFRLGRLSRALTRARSFASAQDDKPGRSLVIVDETVVTLLFASLRSAAHVADSFARLASSAINSVISGCCPHPRAPGAPRPLPGQRLSIFSISGPERAKKLSIGAHGFCGKQRKSTASGQGEGSRRAGRAAEGQGKARECGFNRSKDQVKKIEPILRLRRLSGRV